ncbi:MAG: hypothetical protein QF903_15270 [Planctomycetota bacterium]|jgi:hypothetical protein|nr:hypothetical protein [Planctomycetota bacterium]MDP6763244.1 hypothetical protein [Planctomycetota bacterium]MDP6990831.1 hypothetical protein [Planctomycetota bacterium]
MDPQHDAGAALALLDELDVGNTRHNSNEDLLPHLIGTKELLAEWGARPQLCDAGLCHSLYGTEYFSHPTLGESERDRLRGVIGAEAEALVWLWCYGRRHTMEVPADESAPSRLRERRGGEWLEITAQQVTDLVNLWIADTIEQLPRVPEREVATARTLLRHAPRALPAAAAALEQVIRVNER